MSAQTINNSLTIRRFDLTEADRGALAKLVARDSAAPMEAPVIGIEVEGRLLAAASLSSGAVVADPFSRTEDLRAMLELRTTQLARREARPRRGLRSSKSRVPAAAGLSPLPR